MLSLKLSWQNSKASKENTIIYIEYKCFVNKSLSFICPKSTIFAKLGKS